MGIRQIGVTVVVEALGGGLEARCLKCSWQRLAFYEYELAAWIAEHSRWHELKLPTQIVPAAALEGRDGSIR